MVKNFYIVLCFSMLIMACGGKETGGSNDDGFDRGAMLTNLADNIIIPSFEDFSSKVNLLKIAGSTFTETPTEVNLVNVQTAWLNAYKTWQYIEMFNIGKAEEILFANYMNIYPVATSRIESNIADGDYDLDHVNNIVAQGLPTLDYLLYGIGSDNSSVLLKYTTDTNASGYKTYLTDVIAKMADMTTEIVTDWNGTYRDEFVNSTSNTATSSLNKLINDYIFFYEKGLRANKIAIPVGYFSTDILPEKVEAFYNQEVSGDLASEALNAVVNLFNGKAYNGTTEKLGLKAYLEYLDKDELVAAITDQLASATTSINSLDTNFHDQIVNDKNQMLIAFDELQKVVTYFKTDMLQAFNIAVDYVDGDGD